MTQRWLIQIRQSSESHGLPGRRVGAGKSSADRRSTEIFQLEKVIEVQEQKAVYASMPSNPIH